MSKTFVQGLMVGVTAMAVINLETENERLTNENILLKKQIKGLLNKISSPAIPSVKALKSCKDYCTPRDGCEVCINQ